MNYKAVLPTAFRNVCLACIETANKLAAGIFFAVFPGNRLSLY
jgi:hypothetical protein